MHYYKFHVGDYSARARFLSPIADLAYRRMLDLYYMTERPLPLDVDRLARAIGLHDYVLIVSEVVSDFFLKSEDGYKNKRCDEEIAAYQAKAKRAKCANLSRWGEKKSEVGSDSVLISETNQIPTINHKPLTIRKTTRASRALALRPESVSESLWNDFLEVRKAKRAPLTENAMRGIEREGTKAGLTIEQTIRTCVERSWQGFNASWLESPTSAKNGSGHTKAPVAMGKAYDAYVAPVQRDAGGHTMSDADVQRDRVTMKRIVERARKIRDEGEQVPCAPEIHSRVLAHLCAAFEVCGELPSKETIERYDVVMRKVKNPAWWEQAKVS